MQNFIEFYEGATFASKLTNAKTTLDAAAGTLFTDYETASKGADALMKAAIAAIGKATEAIAAAKAAKPEITTKELAALAEVTSAQSSLKEASTALTKVAAVETELNKVFTAIDKGELTKENAASSEILATATKAADEAKTAIPAAPAEETKPGENAGTTDVIAEFAKAHAAEYAEIKTELDAFIAAKAAYLKLPVNTLDKDTTATIKAMSKASVALNAKVLETAEQNIPGNEEKLKDYKSDFEKLAKEIYKFEVVTEAGSFELQPAITSGCGYNWTTAGAVVKGNKITLTTIKTASGVSIDAQTFEVDAATPKTVPAFNVPSKVAAATKAVLAKSDDVTISYSAAADDSIWDSAVTAVKFTYKDAPALVVTIPANIDLTNKSAVDALKDPVELAKQPNAKIYSIAAGSSDAASNGNDVVELTYDKDKGTVTAASNQSNDKTFDVSKLAGVDSLDITADYKLTDTIKLGDAAYTVSVTMKASELAANTTGTKVVGATDTDDATSSKATIKEIKIDNFTKDDKLIIKEASATAFASGITVADNGSFAYTGAAHNGTVNGLYSNDVKVKGDLTKAENYFDKINIKDGKLSFVDSVKDVTVTDASLFVPAIPGGSSAAESIYTPAADGTDATRAQVVNIIDSFLNGKATDSSTSAASALTKKVVCFDYADDLVVIALDNTATTIQGDYIIALKGMAGASILEVAEGSLTVGYQA